MYLLIFNSPISGNYYYLYLKFGSFIYENRLFVTFNPFLGSKPSPVKDPAWLSGNLDTSNVSSQLAITPVPQVKPVCIFSIYNFFLMLLFYKGVLRGLL